MKILKKISGLLFADRSYYYPRNYYYQRYFDKYEDLNSYLNLTNINNKNLYFTDIKIEFTNNQLLEKNAYKYFRKRYGKPNHEIVNRFPFGEITILFYRIYLAGIRAKMEIHLIQDSLFMYRYSFSYIHQTDKSYLLNILKEKYRISNEITVDSYIMDKNKSMVIISEDVDFSISYILGIFSELSQKMYEVVKEEKAKDLLLEERKRKELFRRL